MYACVCVCVYAHVFCGCNVKMADVVVNMEHTHGTQSAGGRHNTALFRFLLFHLTGNPHFLHAAYHRHDNASAAALPVAWGHIPMKGHRYRCVHCCVEKQSLPTAIVSVTSVSRAIQRRRGMPISRGCTSLQALPSLVSNSARAGAHGHTPPLTITTS